MYLLPYLTSQQGFYYLLLDALEHIFIKSRSNSFLTSWSASINNALRDMVNEVVYLDNIWQEFSYPKGNNITAMNNLELLKHLGFSDSVSAAANHRYPNPEDKENAIEFAI